MADVRERIKTLMDQRASDWAVITEILERVGSEPMEAEDSEKFTRAQASVLAKTTELDSLEETRKLDAVMARTTEDNPIVDGDGREVGNASRDEYNDVFSRFLKFGRDDLEQREKAILRGGILGQEMGASLRALGIATGSAGGYTVPEGFWARISEVQKWYGGVEQLGATVITTDTGADLPWATNDDTGNVGALLSENTQVTDLDVSFGARALSAYTYTTRQIKASLQLIQDSAFDVEAFIVKKFGQRLGRIHNTHFTVGTGISQPQGYITGGTVGKTTAASGAITYGEVIDLIHSVDPAYRNSGNAKLVFHDLILAVLQKLVDTQNRPLWLPSIAVGSPDTFLGYGYVVNNDMASSLVTTAKSMAFGDFSQGYVIRKVRDLTMLRLDERYADFLQVGFLGFDRVDGMVDDSNAYKLLAQV